jgi:hypothetical protein
VTQPTSPVCAASRYAPNTWYQGVAHPRHYCTNITNPHPTQPHVCPCGNSWPGVGPTQCAHCNQTRPMEELRKDDNGKGLVVYLCVDTLQCARARYAASLAADHASVRERIAAHKAADALMDAGVPGNHHASVNVDGAWVVVEILAGEPYTPTGALLAAVKAHARLGHPGPVCAACREHARIAWSVMMDGAGIPWQRSQSDFAASGVPTPTDGATNAGGSYVARALAIVVGLLASIEQAGTGTPVPTTTIAYALGIARGELERAVVCPPPHIRQPGDPVQHGEVLTQ